MKLIQNRPQASRSSASCTVESQPHLGPQPKLSTKYASICWIGHLHANRIAGSHFFLTCSLYGHQGQALAGTVVSSLHRLKDLDNKEGAFFVFGDVSIKVEGTYRLQFDLYEMQEGEQCVHICGTASQPFPVVSSKNFHGMPESTGLTRTFSEQGVRLRLRKEPRSLLKPKGPATDDYKPRHYRTNTYTQPSINETLPSPVSPMGSSYGHGLPLDSPEHQLAAAQIRPTKQLGRSYSYHAEQTHAGSPIFDERQVKRSRTGSEQILTQPYNMQTQPLDTSQYQTMGSYTPNPMPGFAPIPQYGGVTYASPTMRNTYVPQRSSQRSQSYSDPSGHISSDHLRYPTQTNTVHNQSSYMGSMLQGRQQSDTDFASTAYVSRPYTPQSMGIVPTLASDWRAVSESSYQTIAGTSNNDRQIYGVYPSQNPNMSSG